MALSALCTLAVPLGTAFTYQGRLNDGSLPATGIYDLRSTIYDAAGGGSTIAGPLTNSAVGVTNGLFIVALDFGGAAFCGDARWLELGVRTNGAAADFTALSPRQPLTLAPYALYASSAGIAVTATNVAGVLAGGALSGTYSNAVAFNNPASSFDGNGGGLTNVNATTLGGLGASSFWRLAGNGGTTAGADFLGTTDNQPLEFKVNGLRAFRLESSLTNGAPNVIGGSPQNFVGAGIVGAVIAGGGATNYWDWASTNSVLGDFGVVSGGGGNIIQTDAFGAVIAGGALNVIGAWSDYSTIGGGEENSSAAGCQYGTIGGGRFNVINLTTIGGGVIAGGMNNTIAAQAATAAIGGGDGNVIGYRSESATIAGGYHNLIDTNSYNSAIGGGYVNAIYAECESSTIAGGE